MLLAFLPSATYFFLQVKN